jgi:hypothetical protein
MNWVSEGERVTRWEGRGAYLENVDDSPDNAEDWTPYNEGERYAWADIDYIHDFTSIEQVRYGRPTDSKLL